jgi:23S rRNA (pseudouridine1915-N3)-methyltransferase
VRITLVAVGKVKEHGLRDAVDDYAGRIRHYAPFDEIEVADEARLAGAVQKAARGATLVVLDAGGREVDSEEFSRLVGRWSLAGKGDVVFVIGGKRGIPEGVVRAGSFVLSLSRMTLPHRLARLFLVEQIYRAMTMLRGEPYGA